MQVQFPIDLAVDLVDAADRPLRLAQGAQVHFHRAGGGSPPCLADLPGQLLLAEQRGLDLLLDAGFDELGEFLQPLQLLVVHGDADMADVLALAQAVHESAGGCSG